jgi:hypothetical protein
MANKTNAARIMLERGIVEPLLGRQTSGAWWRWIVLIHTPASYKLRIGSIGRNSV